MPTLLPVALSRPFDLSGLTQESPDTIYVRSSYTVDAGDTLDLAGTPGFKLKPRHDSAVTLDINGTVNVVGPDHGDTIGVTTTSPVNTEADINIGPGGALNVTDDVSQRWAYGIDAQTDRVSIENQGELHVSAAAGSAVGVLAIGPAGLVSVEIINDANLEVEANWAGYGIAASAQTCSVTNNGLVSVTAGSAVGVSVAAAFLSVTNNANIVATGTDAAQSAIGVAASNVTNHGVIHAVSEGVAIGLQADFMGACDNDGEISAESDGAVPTIGVLFSSAIGGVMTNSGLIHADVALMSEDVNDPQYGWVSDDTVFNSGHIVGLIMTGAGSDSITNTGDIDGDVFLGAGDDAFAGSDGQLDGTIFGGAGDDTISTGRQNDVVYGGELHDGPSGGDDALSGGGGDDQLFGGQGVDTLVGGAGADTLAGGDGGDLFIFGKLSDSVPGEADLITDLTEADTIDLRHIDADTTQVGDQAFHLVSAFTGAAGELVVSYDPVAGLTTIAGDVDGDGLADLMITASGDQSGFTNFVL